MNRHIPIDAGCIKHGPLTSMQDEMAYEWTPVRRFILRWEYVLTGAVVFAAVVSGVSL